MLEKPKQTFWPTQYMHPNIHSSIIYNTQDTEEPKCPLTDEWVNKICDMYTHIPIHAWEYYSAIIKNESLPFAALLDLGSIMLSEKSQGKTNAV